MEEEEEEAPLLCQSLGEGDGGDGRGSVRPAALLWRVTSSAGPRLCGSSTKPRRGQREEAQGAECWGGGGWMRATYGVNEPPRDWERERRVGVGCAGRDRKK